jgi:hypothetical protein
MKTSYFAKYNREDGINIALIKPKFFKGESYPDLYPTWNILKKYKKYHNKELYVYEYQKYILSKLDPYQIYNDLKNNVLLCYEKSGDFCHRRIVAAWIEKHTGNKVKEIDHSIKNNLLTI